MKASCVIVAHGMCRANLALQPWRYLHELALRRARRGPVVIVTDGAPNVPAESWSEGITLVPTPLLSIRRQRSLAALIEGFDPEEIWWSSTPRSVAYWPTWRRLRCPITAFITCTLYPWPVLLRAVLHGVPLSELRTLLQQRLMPRWLFVSLLRDDRFARVITQSEANRDLLLAAGLPSGKVHVVPVGIEDSDRRALPAAQVATARVRLGAQTGAASFLYLGATRRIRGIDALLAAAARAVRAETPLHLAVLARAADAATCTRLYARCEALGLGGHVTVIGGWLSKDELLACIDACDVVVQPFVVVPSEVPIAVLEALVRGKPVIASPIDGIPELVRTRGVIVDPLDTVAFADALRDLAHDSEKRVCLGDAAKRFMSDYPDWERVGEMMNAFSNTGKKGAAARLADIS